MLLYFIPGDGIMQLPHVGANNSRKRMMFDFLRNFFGDGSNDFGGSTVTTHYEQFPTWHNDFGAGPDYSSGSGTDDWNCPVNTGNWPDNGF